MPLAWPDDERPPNLDRLQAWVDDCERAWEEFLARPFDTERVLTVDAGAHRTRAGIFVAQAINHASHHRKQIRAILTGLRIEPPDLQAWDYAWATGRIGSTLG